MFGGSVLPVRPRDEWQRWETLAGQFIPTLALIVCGYPRPDGRRAFWRLKTHFAGAALRRAVFGCPRSC